MLRNRRTSTAFALFFCWVTASVAEDIIEITRDYLGDIFTLDGVDCNETSACDKEGRQAAEILGEPCRCQCAPSHYTFRDDIQQCVKEIGECQMAMFVRPYSIERIPLIFLPSRGQFVFPGAHIAASGTITLTSSKFLSCDVTSSEYMTPNGWYPIEDGEKEEKFGVSYEGNKTFLKWLGSDEDRSFLQHRLLLIRLVCVSEVTSETFEPCAALRIGWTRAFPRALQSESSKRNAFVIVGLCLGILGLTYVMAFFIYLKLRKKTPMKNLPENINVHSRKTDGDSLAEANQVPTSTRHLRCQYIPKEGALSSRLQHNGEANGLATENNDPKIPSHPGRRFIYRMQGMIQSAKQRITNIRYRTKLAAVSEENIETASNKDEEEFENNKLDKGGEVKYVSRIESVYSIPVDAIPERQYTYSYESNHATRFEASKFDLFRRDLYEKIRQIHENETNQSKVMKEYPSHIPPCYRVRNVSVGYSSIPEEGKRNCKGGRKQFEEPLSQELKEEKLTEKEAQKSDLIRRNYRNRPSSNEKEFLACREIRECHEIHNYPKEFQLEDSLSETSCRGSNKVLDNPILHEVTIIREEQSTSMDESDCKCKKSSDISASGGDDDSIDADQYLQLSSQVAQKLSTYPVPDLNCHPEEQQTNSLGQFWKDVRGTFDKFKDRFEAKPLPERPSSSSNDNWMLKKNEVSTNRFGRLVRKISFTRHDKFKKFRSAKINETCDSLSKKSAIREINETLTNIDSQSLPNENQQENKTPQQAIVAIDETPTLTIHHNEETRDSTENDTSKSEALDNSNKDEDSTAPIGDQSIRDEFEDAESSTTCEVSMPSSTSGDECESSITQSESVSAKSSNIVITETMDTQSQRQSFDSDTLSMACSDMTEDSLNTFGYASGAELLKYSPTNHVDVCVSHLEETVVDSNGKILRGGRATKGFDIAQYFKEVGWEHICHEKGKSSPNSSTDTKLLSTEQRMNKHNNIHYPVANSTHRHSSERENKAINCEEECRSIDGSSGGRCSKIKRRRVSPRRKRRDSNSACRHHSRKRDCSRRLDSSTSRNSCCTKKVSMDAVRHGKKRNNM